VVVFKMESDVMLYIVGGAEENEVLLYRYRLSRVWLGEHALIYMNSVVLALRDSLNILLK
jgi:hypothetical protein